MNVCMQSGSTQQQALWQRAVQTPYKKLPAWPSPAHTPLATARTLVNIATDKAFQRDVVNAPYYDSRDTRPERAKLFHTLGVCCTADWVIDTPSPYTGIFATGGPAIMRLSLATNDQMFCPGVGIKVLRDDAPSANLLAAPGLDPQDRPNFLARPFLTRVPPPNQALARFFFGLLGERFDPYAIGVQDLAAVDRHGHTAAEARAPEILALCPQTNLALAPGEDWREAAMHRLHAGDRLWDIYADSVRIGTLRLTSPVIATSFGDRELHFPHRAP